MRKTLFIFVMLATLLMLGACEMTTPKARSAALMKPHTQASLQALKEALSALSYGRDIGITNSAFQDSSRLLVERKPPLHNNQPVPLTENEVLVFSLWLEEDKCVINREDTQERQEIDKRFCQLKSDSDRRL